MGIIKPQGCFVGWFLSPKTAQDLASWARFMGVQHVLNPEEMHATVIYSPEAGLDSDLHGTRPLPMPVELSHLNRPRTRILGQPGETGSLVTTYDSDSLGSRHRFFRDTFGLEPTFPTFIPHVSLSYNASEQHPEVIQRLIRAPCGIPIVFDREQIAYPNP